MLDPLANVTFGGDHLEGRSNGDVSNVDILYSNTSFMIPQLFTTFPNLSTLEISLSGLQSINIPDFIQLRRLLIDRNNISRIERAAFVSQRRLTYLNARDNIIREIDEYAFVGLSSLESLVLIDNHIENLAPRTFQPLTNISYLDLEGNRLTSISADLFSQNTQIRSLYLDFNQIEEISPRFSANLGDKLRYIDLEGNNCIDRRFSINDDDDFSRIILHNSLRTCYNNFNGQTSDLKRVTLEFQGPMRLYDEFDNLIVSL